MKSFVNMENLEPDLVSAIEKNLNLAILHGYLCNIEDVFFID